MTSLKLVLGIKTPSFGPLGVAYYCQRLIQNSIQIEWSKDDCEATLLTEKTSQSVGPNNIFRTLNIHFKELSKNNVQLAQVDHWLDFTQDFLFSTDYKKLSTYFDELDSHLTLASYMVGYSLTTADFSVWGALKANPAFNKQLKNGKLSTPHLARWYQHMNELPFVVEAMAALEAQKNSTKDRTDKGSMDIQLPDAIEGRVVTRFPPEPSGYLHIGHAKAAILNNYFAKSYKGKLIVRFDDTNPSKEKMEFESSIKEDLLLLGIKADIIVHTSDHFEKIYQYALQLIKEGLAYVDNTDTDTMRNERFDGIESKNRNLSIEKNLELFKEMKLGTEIGVSSCLRAKMDMSDLNKCMRDPVIFRCNLTPHHIHGDKWKMYPTYDFACPIVDSLDGVTHALRTIEYRDRNPQYEWFLVKLKLRKVHIWDFSRLNFVYTLLSKRKLTWFVEEKLVSGWDDPRFPTVRGIRRRGMTIDALIAYILSQGASQRELMLEWDKIWAINKKIIDPISPRHTSLIKDQLVSVNVVDDVKFHAKNLPKHKKNAEIGEKVTTYGKNLFLAQKDCIDLEIGEEVTFMDWGNVIVKSIEKAGDVIKKVEITLNLDGDFKKTKKKLTWLCPGEKGEHELSELNLYYYDYLITKKKLEGDEEIKDILNTKSVSIEKAVGDSNLKLLKNGDIIQLEREGYFICDKPSTAEDPAVHLIYIPDGKIESVSLRNTSGTESKVEKPQKRVAVTEKSVSSNMYPAKPFYEDISGVEKDNSNMYRCAPYYPDLLNAPTPSKKEKKKKEPKPVAAAAEPEGEASIISKLDIVVGKIVDVRLHPDADSLYVELIDVGESQPREVVSGLVKFLKPEELLGKTILVLKNLKPVAMRGIKSHAMVLCASNDEHTKVEFLEPPAGSIPGEKVFFKGHLGEPEEILKPKKKVWETVQVDFKTRADLVACWKNVPFETARGLVKSSTLSMASIK